MRFSSGFSLVRSQLKLGVALVPLALAHVPAHGQTQSPAVTQTRTAPSTLPEPEPEENSAEEALEQSAILPSAAVDERREDPKDIVVTGTSLRGVAPTGSNVVTVTERDIQASGASSANQLLAQIPQLGGNYFNNIPQLEGSAQGGLDVNRPNARGVPQSNLDTGVSTLVLVNGQRQSGGGIRNVGTDPDGIPVALLQRVELNTDGGSSVYGSHVRRRPG
jgi:iron complex outermembrane receptor protein